jgi:hypothetical protein
MSLREFNATDDRPLVLQNQPSGNGAGLGNFHTVNPEDAQPSNMPKFVGVLAVALMIGTAGVALYPRSTSPSQPQPIAAANNLLARPAAPAQQAAITPDANIPAAAPAPSPSAQATKAAKAATADPDSLRSAMVKTHSPAKIASTAGSHVASGSRAASARAAADSNQTSQPQQQAATPHVAALPPPPSEVGTTNTQSSVAESAATPDIAATPQAPAEDQQSVPTPAQPPAQSAGQVNQ